MNKTYLCVCLLKADLKNLVPKPVLLGTDIGFLRNFRKFLRYGFFCCPSQDGQEISVKPIAQRGGVFNFPGQVN